jgi:hypothetical protein
MPRERRSLADGRSVATQYPECKKSQDCQNVKKQDLTPRPTLDGTDDGAVFQSRTEPAVAEQLPSGSER